jgi:crotonobetainyl-CoA:carnitine CoA-transferase CaiB-like acyl-CoA transferase
MSNMLAPYRVLDLTNERGLLCGQILGDLGADVVQIEPPGGSSARRLGPFLADQPGPDRSLYWWAYNRNKRGVTLDWRRDEGRAILLELVRSADFLIESEAPGSLEERGLGFAALATVNPKLIHVSISAFGQAARR